MITMDLKLTPTQQRMYDVLQDGGEHGAAELVKCLDDEYAASSTISIHIAALRRHLGQHGLSIACIQIPGHEASYRIQRRLPSPYDGRK